MDYTEFLNSIPTLNRINIMYKLMNIGMEISDIDEFNLYMELIYENSSQFLDEFIQSRDYIILNDKYMSFIAQICKENSDLAR